MQLIGIYIDDALPKVKKTLKENWYPFGNYLNYDELQFHKFDKIKENSKKNRDFINQLYLLPKNPNIYININCIVGKNGSGKSTVLDILYRIINNFGCKIKELLPHLNPDYNPIWANGINASLYFESENKIFCIKIEGDINKQYYNFKEKKNDDNLPVSLYRNGVKVHFFPKTIDKTKNRNKQILEHIQKYIFDYIPYTIATNYSLYTGKSDDDYYEQLWQKNLYQKNDGYITPIVFAPYKENNTIEISRENMIGQERVMYLSLLLACNGENFIESYKPYSLKYRYNDSKYFQLSSLYNDYYKETNYHSYIIRKIADLISNYEKIIKSDFEIDFNFFDTTTDFTKKQWWIDIETILSTIGDKWKSYISQNTKFDIYIKDACDYLTYKTIKICLLYEKYKKQFNETNIVDYYINNHTKSDLSIINKIIKQLTDETKIDHINLKVIQCLNFFKNSFFEEKIQINYTDKADSFGCEEIQSAEFIKFIKEKASKENKVITYDYIVINSLPSFFYKIMLYQDIHDENVITPLTSMSSGQQHLYFSLSYAIYHMKNIESVLPDDKRLKYKNINLIFDEAELYYHPEYQRKFLKNILDVLNRSSFNKFDINSINITIITHSPFIISDIPSSNILALENGKKDINFDNTFCSNIYDLLKSKFFMDYTVGAWGQKIIDYILATYQIYEKPKYTEDEKKQLEKYKKKQNVEFINNVINSIGDSYLQKTLKTLHNKITNQININTEIYKYIDSLDEEGKRKLLNSLKEK